jgi:hypothetical protein
MYRHLYAGGLLLGCLASSAAAQVASRPDAREQTDVLVLDHDFTASPEILRVFLQRGQVYRAELSSPDITLVIVGVVRSTPVPRTYPYLATDTPSGMSITEIHPLADAEYEIRAVELKGAGAGTRLRLYRDLRASRRQQKVRETPGWEIGVEVAGGWHSGFVQSSSAPPAGSSPDGGSDIEGCFSARRGPEIPRLGLCVLGIGHQSQPGSASILWFFTEPRLRIFGTARPGESNWELGALFRAGLGSMSARISGTPAILAPGVYLARHIRTSPRGAGWSFHASYSRAWFKGFPKPSSATETVTPQSNRVMLGVGWYR